MARRATKTASSFAENVPNPEPLDFAKPFQKLKGESFYRFTREYPNQEGTSTYVYQVLPKINRQQVGIKTNYVSVLAEPVTEDMLLQKHGSGMYLLKFTDSNQPNGLSLRAQTKVQIYDPDMPNTIDPQELVLDDKDSKPYLDDMRARGALKELEKPKVETQNDATAALTSMAHLLLEDRLKAAPEKVEARSPIDDAFRIADRLKPVENPMVKELLEMMKITLQSKVQPAAEAADPLAVYERVSTIIEKIAPRTSARGGFDWGSLLQSVPGILTGMSQMIAAVRLGQVAQPQPAGVGVGSATAQPAALISEEQLPAGDLDMMNPKVIVALQKVGNRALRAFERGVSGEHFAAALCVEEDGERIYDLLHDLGKDGIFQALSMVPGLAEKLEPQRGKIELWLSEFIGYGDTGEAD